MSERVGHVSASSIAAFKACPTRYRIGYVESIRQAQEPEPLRVGTALHKGLEILGMPANTLVDQGLECSPPVRITEENRLEIAVETACGVYTTIPDWADATDWAVEREIVANTLAAYHWHYQSAQEYEVVATELSFELPLVNPETGHPTPNFRRVGKIDQVLRNRTTGILLIGEHKSTSKPIDSGSTYWDRLRMDTQSKFYICAARDMTIPDTDVPTHAPVGTTVSGLLHDVIHKPAIRPKKLAQAESAEFVKTGEYCGQKFAVVTAPEPGPAPYLIDGLVAEIELGAEPKAKKDGIVAPRPFAVRETPGMFGARLLQAMTTEPEKYFARREIAFTDAELRDFRYQVWNIQKTMNEMERSGHWFQNEQQCEATFRCAFCPLCYMNIQCCDGVTVPPGFRRLRTEEVETAETGDAE